MGCVEAQAGCYGDSVERLKIGLCSGERDDSGGLNLSTVGQWQVVSVWGGLDCTR